MTSLELFMTLFRGRENCHGVHIPATTCPIGAKAKGASYTKTEQPTAHLYRDHIEGKQGLGIVPLREDCTVYFAALDVDVYPLNPALYLSIVALNKLPMHLFRSKSGGLHAFIFFQEPVEAKKLKPVLEELKPAFGLSATTEVFPKQAHLAEGKSGNWINLPYYAAKETTRYLYDHNTGGPVVFDAAVAYLYDHRTTLAELQKAVKNLPFSSGPPCLQALYLTKHVSESNHNRNMFLFNAGVYLRQRNPQDYMARLGLINKTLDGPVTEYELNSTIKNSLLKGNYSYQCDDATLKAFCNRHLCEKRKFGKNAGINSELIFERLVQVQTEPPYYKWKVNGTYMLFENESELRCQSKFQDYCIRFLHFCPQTMKSQVWYGILNKSLATMEVEVVSKEEQITETTLFHGLMRKFFLERVKAKVPEQILLGQPYLDPLTGKHYFRIEDFVKFVYDDKVQKSLTLVDIRRELKRYGAKADSLYLPTKKKVTRAWSIADIYLEESPVTGELSVVEQALRAGQVPLDLSPELGVNAVVKAETTVDTPAESTADRLKNAVAATRAPEQEIDLYDNDEEDPAQVEELYDNDEPEVTFDDEEQF